MQTNNRLITDYYNYSLTIDYENIKNNSYIDYLRRNVKYNENTFITKVDITLINRGAPIINNITTEQRVLNEETGETYTFPIGYYTLEELFAKLNTFCEISFFSYGEFFGRTKLETILNFTNAQELKKILGFINSPDIVSGISEDLVDITQGYEELRVYSSMIKTSDQQRCPLAVIRIDDPRSCNNFSTYCEIPINTYFLSSIVYTFENGFSQEFTPNCNIRINLSLNTFSTVTSDKVDTSYSLLSCINSGEVDSDGVYSKKLEQPIRFNSEDTFIRQTSILFDGKVYNLPEDQILKINGKRYIIPKGSYNSRELLAKLNSLCSSLFSFVTEGENAYMLKIEDFNTIDFSSAKGLASILGFTGNEYQSKEGGDKYQLITGENTFKLTVGHGIHYLDVQTGIYSESEFIRKLEKVIKTYVPDLVVKEHGYHYSFSSETYPDLKIESPLDDSQCSLHKYYWSSAINHRKEGDNSIIPKVGCFYFDENITASHCLEYFDIINYQDRQEFTLTANITDTSGNQIVQKTFNLSQYIRHNNSTSFMRTFYNEVLIDYCKQYSWVWKSHAYFQTIDTTHRIAFIGSPTFIQAFHLPTTPARSFDMYCDNMYHKGGTPDFEDLTLYYQMEGSDQSVDLLTNNNLGNYIFKMRECRSRINRYIYEGLGLSSANYYLYYETPFGCNLVPNAIMTTNNVKGRFFGTAIDKGVIKGLHTDYNRKNCNIYFDFTALNTHRLTLGYTNMEGVKAGLQQFYKEKELSDTVLPSLTFELTNNAVVARNNNALIKYTLDDSTSMKYLFFQDNSRKRDKFGDRMEFYSPYANIEVTVDNYQIIISKPDGVEQTINIPLGWYTKESLFETFNSYLEYPFVRKETYWVLDYCPNKLDYNLEIDFNMMTSELRVYDPDKKVLESLLLKGGYPINITNGFNLVNVFTNIVETSANTDNYLTSFVIDNTNGKNVSAAGVKHSYANSNKPIDRIIANSNINNIDYYFTREDGQPFNINGKINCTLEIVE